MQQVRSKVSSCRRSAADCSCGILVCGKSAPKFHPAADLPQTVPVAYWYAASLQQNFILPQICRRLFLWHTGMRQVCSKISFCRILRHTLCRRLKVCGRSAADLRQVCGRSAAYFSLSYGQHCKKFTSQFHLINLLIISNLTHTWHWQLV